MSRTKNTPMIEQYLSIKRKYYDAILLYRMGDFYEMFFDDAKIASQVLEILLTSRNKNDINPVPMCGFPYRSVNSYVAKLIASGHKVAVCDQIGDSSKSKGLVERQVVRVITPGMVIDDDLLDGKSNNFILSLNYRKSKFGISFLDISTGIFFVTESLCSNAVLDEIMRISPREILISKLFKKSSIYEFFRRYFVDRHISFSDKSSFNYKTAHKTLLDQFNVYSLEGFGCDEMNVGIGAAGALIKYVRETQKQELRHLRPIQAYFLNDFLIVDEQSCKNLELFSGIRSGSQNQTLVSVLDNTVTSMGARLLNNWMRYPLKELDQILKRHDAVSEAVKNDGITQKVRKTLNFMFDIERFVSKVSVGDPNARDLTLLKKSILVLPELFKLLSNFRSVLYRLPENLDSLYELVDLIDKSIRSDASTALNEGGIIREGFNHELDLLIDVIRNSKKWIANLEIEEKKMTGINSLKVKYNKIFGYYIEVPKKRSKFVPKHYVCKQTLVNAERYTTDVLKQFESDLFNAENQRAFLELEIFRNIIVKVKKRHCDIQSISDFISVVDCLTSFAFIAHKNDYCRPVFNTEGLISIESGRHPVVEKLIDAEQFVPNSIKMDNTHNQVIIITGPNMVGKSTILRQIALCIIMAQIGSFVPAKKANLAIVDRIFTRVGALDNLAAGQSTFMVEMQEIAKILNNSTKDSLVIIDEIGRGTSTFDGLSIAWAIAEHLHDLDGVGVKSMFATHYHELTELEEHKPKVKNFNIIAKEINDEIIFMRKLVRGSTNKSYGIQVAHLAGMPKSVVERSKEILCQFNNRNSNLKVTTNCDTSVMDYGNERELEEYNLTLKHLKEQINIISMLKNANILQMNPIEALNYLNKLQMKAKVIP